MSANEQIQAFWIKLVNLRWIKRVVCLFYLILSCFTYKYQKVLKNPMIISTKNSRMKTFFSHSSTRKWPKEKSVLNDEFDDDDCGWWSIKK